jgi:hypothetical protein
MNAIVILLVRHSLATAEAVRRIQGERRIPAPVEPGHLTPNQ